MLKMLKMTHIFILVYLRIIENLMTAAVTCQRFVLKCINRTQPAKLVSNSVLLRFEQNACMNKSLYSAIVPFKIEEKKTSNI